MVGPDQGLFEDRFEIAAVIPVAEWRGVGNLLGADQIAPAQFDRIDAGHLAGDVDQALHQIIRFGPAGAAIRPIGTVLVSRQRVCTLARGMS